ncbi:ATP-binding protein [Aspergillus aculeatinus CBS 121060]|uniref:P-loop containing nucleoside triphosphate hydrolase protein n=1 Tax=Aspergillus aculeatinus CBS 121060 TaxID=1448322 RepID=A0ACD1GTG6_9EURO|nr:P-loop containing nucleoside triphosphate hydrolase protein [Aspergillus aculeatinus CBS 121060]RAH64471.1 P-loop containing nucleoside triphosphate hydrolase protein [Aspergillus aculeatinus CBS 121060]
MDKLEPTEEAAKPGSICEAHVLYQTAPDERGRTSWTREPPKDLLDPAETPLSGRFVLLVRKVKCYDGKRNLKIHSVIVQSQPLKGFLARLLTGYPGITSSLDRLEFHQPFQPFVHRWEEFCQARAREDDPTTQAHVELLFRILEEELRETIARKNDLVKNQVITHDLLWAIFEPGAPIIRVVDGRQRAFRFQSGSYDKRSGVFEIAAQYVDWDGEGFGYETEEFTLSPYEGTTPIVDLSSFPLAYHREHARIREELIARGKLWEGYRGYHYQQYKGLAKGYIPVLNRQMKFNIQGRIVIDTEAYNNFNAQEEITGLDRIAAGGGSSTTTTSLSDDQRLIATPIVRGYALQEKRWLAFFVDGVKDIVWDAHAFDSLVLPHEQRDLKKLVLGFARAQARSRDAFDDVIHGKGRGVIMLLSGPPGVGKTLTAESVAEVMQVPLYVLSAGDLGTTPERVENTLRDVLTMIPRWGAIILLDEADVFMEARDTLDLKRNELVSIFLRLLEYYEGILFLTTNRAEHIDPAFESRIHMSIRYPELTFASRHQIWRQFLTQQRHTEPFSEDELDRLAALELNGRQIKNVLRTAHLLAEEEGCALTHAHVQGILSLRDYLKQGGMSSGGG